MKNLFLMLLCLCLFVSCKKQVSIQYDDPKEELFYLHNYKNNKLTRNDLLDQTAQNHANWMAKNDILSHNEGTKDLSYRILKKDYTTAGENIACGQRSAKEVFSDWMNSPGHRANILNKNFKYIGFGIKDNYWCVVFSN